MIRKFSTKLLFSDTDSLCYELHENNLYKKMYKFKELFDLSNFLYVVNITAVIIRKYSVK